MVNPFLQSAQQIWSPKRQLWLNEVPEAAQAESENAETELEAAQHTPETLPEIAQTQLDIRNRVAALRPDLIRDTEGETLSPAALTNHLVALREGSPQRIRQIYGKRYPEVLVGELTEETRDRIYQAEIERFGEIHGSTIQAELERIIQTFVPLQSLEHSLEHLSETPLGPMLERMNILEQNSATEYVRLHRERQDKRDLIEQREKNPELLALREQLRQHNSSRREIFLRKEQRDQSKWKHVPTVLKTVAVGSVVGAGIGGLASLGASFGFFTGIWKGLTFLPKLITTALQAPFVQAAGASTASWGVTKVGSILGLGYHYLPAARSKIEDIQHDREEKRIKAQIAEKEAELDLPQLKAEVKAADQQLEYLRQQNQQRTQYLNQKRQDYLKRKHQVQKDIDLARRQGNQRPDDVKSREELEEELEHIRMTLISLNAVKRLFSVTKSGMMARLPAGAELSSEEIVSSLQSLDNTLDPEINDALRTLGQNAEEQLVSRQQGIQELVERPVLTRELERLNEGEEDALLSFVQQSGQRRLRGQLRRRLRDRYPHLQRLVSDITDLPARSSYKHQLCDKLEEALSDSRRQQGLQAVQQSLTDIRDESLKRALRENPHILQSFLPQVPFEDFQDRLEGQPDASEQIQAPRSGDSFERYLARQSLSALAELERALRFIRDRAQLTTFGLKLRPLEEDDSDQQEAAQDIGDIAEQDIDEMSLEQLRRARIRLQTSIRDLEDYLANPHARDPEDARTSIRLAQRVIQLIDQRVDDLAS